MATKSIFQQKQFTESHFFNLCAKRKIIVTDKRTSKAKETTTAMKQRNRKIFMTIIHSKTVYKDAHYDMIYDMI